MKSNLSENRCSCQYRHFIIQADDFQNYPFHGLKLNNFCTLVKIKVDSKQLKYNFSVLEKLALIQGEKFIQLKEILQEHSQHQVYTLTYQYVPFSIQAVLNSLNQVQRAQKFQADLEQICAELVKLRIKPMPRVQDFGLTCDKKLKFYLRPDFDMISVKQSQQKLMIRKMVNEFRHKFQQGFLKQQLNTQKSLRKISEDEKVDNISEKIKKLRNDIFKMESKTLENYKRCSLSQKNSADNSDQFNNTGKDEGIQSSRVHSDKQPYFQDSYSCRQTGKDKKKRTASFQLDEKKPRSEIKHKKASWGEQNSTIVESDRASQLQLRITQALQKTQKTLKKYEKLRQSSKKKKKL